MKKAIIGSLLLFSSLMIAEEVKNEKALKVKEEVVDKDKSGFILGVELQIGGGAGKLKYDFPHYEITRDFDTKSFATTPLLVLGYQKYFGEDKKMGFDVRAKLGVGYFYSNNLFKKMSYYPGVADADKDIVDYDKGAYLKFDSISYKIGIEANYLYDFLETDNYTLGLNAGIGAGVIYSQVKNGSGYFYAEDGKFNFGQSGLSFFSRPYYNISPKIGMHYYYGKHQFNLDFSMDILSHSKTTAEKEKYFGNLYNFYANLGYTYRF